MAPTSQRIRLILIIRVFANEQYFDPNGFFIFTVFSGPVILNCFLIVVSAPVLSVTLYPLHVVVQLCWLYSVWHMMVQLGTIKHQRKTHREKKLTRDALPASKRNKQD